MFVQEKTKTQSSDSKKSQPLYTHFKALKESSIDLSSFGTSTITSLVIIIAFTFDLHYWHQVPHLALKNKMVYGVSHPSPVKPHKNNL